MFPEREICIWSKNAYTYILEKRDDPMRDTLDRVARELTTMTRQAPTAQMGPFTVVCRYSEGKGVGPHKDDDFNTTSNVIVSMTLIGAATFSVMIGKTWHDMHLEEGDIVIFDRNVLHKAGGARGTRVNVTTRYARKGDQRVFITPEWYDNKT